MKIISLFFHGLLLSLAESQLVKKDDFQQVHVEKGVGYAICSGTESYYTLDPDNCRNFYGCVYDEHAETFHVYKFECQAGLAYDEVSHACQEETTVDRCWYTCPEGWELFQNSCYFFSSRKNKQNKFTKALDACQDMDGYLVEIESKAEDDFIIEKAMSLASHGNDGLDYWIGAQDSDNDGNWNWATSGNPLIYTNWWVDHGTLNSTCIQLLKNGKTSPRKLDSFYWTMAAGKFNTKDCSDGDNAIICERTPDMNL